MQLSLGPIPYYWSRTAVHEFYQRAMASAVDVIYLGETVCSKRHELRPADWLALARELAQEGDKQIVLSTLALIESASELATLRRLCQDSELLVEANDMAAVHFLAERGVPFVCGPTINNYNHHSVRYLAGLGMRRWVMPVEMTRESLAAILERLKAPGSDNDADGKNGERTPQTEVFVHGKLPLAYSARCFTARALDLSKDQCGFSCLHYPDGMPLQTQAFAGQPNQPQETLFTLNGIQTLSGHTYNLLNEVPALGSLGVDLLRISPEGESTFQVIEESDRARHSTQPLGNTIATDQVNGYWFGRAGMGR